MALNAEKTVGEIAAEFPAAVQVFEKQHIDYCCGGKHPLVDACRVAGASAEEVMEEIEIASHPENSDQTLDWNAAPLPQLVQHIVDKHHAWLYRQLPVIEQLMDRVVAAHGGKRPEPIVPGARDVLR